MKAIATALALICCARAVLATEDPLPQMGYAPLARAADSEITFDNPELEPYVGRHIQQAFRIDQVKFSELFRGQYLRREKRNEVTGTVVDTPLSLGTRTTRKPSNLILMRTRASGTALAGLTGTEKPVSVDNRLFPDIDPVLDHPLRHDKTAIGNGAVAMQFYKPQPAVGFRILRLNNLSKVYLRSTAQSPVPEVPLYYIKFFRADGSLIAEKRIRHLGNTGLAFALCDKSAGIAGVQITTEDPQGFVVDDIRYFKDGTRPEDFSPCPLWLS